jgi:hypothetical protein
VLCPVIRQAGDAATWLAKQGYESTVATAKQLLRNMEAMHILERVRHGEEHFADWCGRDDGGHEWWS